MEWISAIDKRPHDRNVKDVETICSRLRRVDPLGRILPPTVLQQLALCAYYEDLEKGVTVYRQGDTGKCWYACLAGQIEFARNRGRNSQQLNQMMNQQGSNDDQTPNQQLGPGTTFGEGCAHELPRDTSVITVTACELLRVEQTDFRLLFDKNKELFGELARIRPSRAVVGEGQGQQRDKGQQQNNASAQITNAQQRKSAQQQHAASKPNAALANNAYTPNPVEPITDQPSQAMARAGWALRALLLRPSSRDSTCLKDRVVSGRMVRRCAPGTELVDWLLAAAPGHVSTRAQATAMWQALLEEGVIKHVNGEQHFKDKCFLYRFWQDEEGASAAPTNEDCSTAEEQIRDVLTELAQRGPDAHLRCVLRKPQHERTSDDLETIYEELLHVRALAHLSNSIKRELAAVVLFEAHYARAGRVLFHQGDEGRSWYIIARGSVDVVIHGRGTVTTLREGDDFGKLALINDAPRAATIVLRENNCHFLRVDKNDFNRIVRDVEANTVRLKEHGCDVLILEKHGDDSSPASSGTKPRGAYYNVVSGTPQKMLEHLLETRVDQISIDTPGNDVFLDDFLLTHVAFMSTRELVDELQAYYRWHEDSNDLGLGDDAYYALTCKRRVVRFVHRWCVTGGHAVFDDEHAVEFIEGLATEVEADCLASVGGSVGGTNTSIGDLHEEAQLMHHVLQLLHHYEHERALDHGHKWKLPPGGQPVTLFDKGGAEQHLNSDDGLRLDGDAGVPNSDNDGGPRRPRIRATDDIIYRVYCADHTYCTLRTSVATNAEQIKYAAADKLKIRQTEDLALVEVKSNGERSIFADDDVGIPTSLTVNGRVFVSLVDHLDALTPLVEQEGATVPSVEGDVEQWGTRELAEEITLFDWRLFRNVHERELLYKTFGGRKFAQSGTVGGGVTANLDTFIRRFNEIQYWVATELCTTTSLGRRVSLLRKFIKLAACCRQLQNLHAFCAIVAGLSNVAVSRLTSTWDKIPSKLRKLYTEMESVMDPSRNHRTYRTMTSRLLPPVIPFMPLLLKDAIFAHEGNRTCTLDGLVNFEKMHMIASTMRSMRHCRSRQLVIDPENCADDSGQNSSATDREHLRRYVTAFKVIDNQKQLTQMSQKLEPRR